MNITPDEQELKNKLYSKIHDPYSWRLVHDLDTDLTGDAMYDIMNLITLHTQEAYKKGYIAGGIAHLTNPTEAGEL